MGVVGNLVFFVNILVFVVVVFLVIWLLEEEYGYIFKGVFARLEVFFYFYFICYKGDGEKAYVLKSVFKLKNRVCWVLGNY